MTDRPSPFVRALSSPPQVLLGIEQTACRGSVLVPVLAAMLILLLSGFALTEAFGGQRLRGVLALDSARAFWVADAGIQHAALQGAAIEGPVAFAGGTYAVAKNGTEYTATSTWNQATRAITEDLTSVPSESPSDLESPLDEAASEATAVRTSNKRFDLDLVSTSDSDVRIASFDLSADVATEEVKKIKLDGEDIWKENSGVDLPVVGTALNEGSSSDRTIQAGESPDLRIEWKSNPSGTVTYTLVLHFTDGSSSILVFPITW